MFPVNMPSFSAVRGEKEKKKGGETHAVAPVKDAGEAPRPVLERLDVHDLDEEQVARLGALDLEGPGEVVDAGEVHVLDVVGAVIVLDLAARPARR